MKRLQEIHYRPSPEAYTVLINGNILAQNESPQQMFERVVTTLFDIEKVFHVPPKETLDAKLLFAKYMAEKRFTPGTPTLTNAGRTGYEDSALSSCAIIPVDLRKKQESEIAIKAYYRQNMGSGFDLTAYENPIELLLWLNELSVKETATGAYDRYIGNMATLHVSHPQIIDFIQLKSSRNLSHFNLSVIIDDDFMESAKNKQHYILTNGNKIQAHDILTLISESAWLSGDPSMLNMEKLNSDNPVRENMPYITAPPCAEMGLSTGETCQFVYINISKFLMPDGIDYTTLEKVVRVVTRALDNTVELGINKYPDVRSTDVAKYKRKIGIAISGLADTLLYYSMAYTSKEARILARDVVSFINYISKLASVDLARQRGSCEAMNDETNQYYKNYLFLRYGNGTNSIKSEQWRELSDKIKSTKLLRNIHTIALPPAARVSILMDASFGLEPIFGVPNDIKAIRQSVKNYLQKHVGSKAGEILKQAVKEGTFQNTKISYPMKQCLQTAKEISPKHHLKMVASLVGTDSVADETASKTVNLPKDSTPKEIYDMFLYAHKLGLKNIAVYRDGTFDDQPYKL